MTSAVVEFRLRRALDKLGLDDHRALRVWTGVRADSALNGRRQEMGAEIELGPIGQISRSVSDIAEAERWYREVLGLKHLYTFGKLAFFDCGGVRLFLEESAAASKPQSILYFRVADIHAAHAQLTARGAAFESAPHLIHRHDDGLEEWMAFFPDNEGRLLAVMEQVRPAAAERA